MMYRAELVEEITVENVTEKINAKIEEMEKESHRLVTMSFWGTERAVLVFKKGLKGSLLYRPSISGCAGRVVKIPCPPSCPSMPRKKR